MERCFEISTVGPDAKALAPQREQLMAAVLGNSGDTRAPFAQLMTDKSGTS